MFFTSKNKYLLNDMNIIGTCSIPLSCMAVIEVGIMYHQIVKGTIIKTKKVDRGV